MFRLCVHLEACKSSILQIHFLVNDAATFVKLLVEANHGHHGDRGVIIAALKALNNQTLSHGQGGQVDELVRAGAHQAIVEVLSKHRGDEGVCEAACAALSNLAAGSDARKKAIVGAGAVPPLAAAWSTHTGRTKAYAHKVLNTLGFNGDGTKK